MGLALVSGALHGIKGTVRLAGSVRNFLRMIETVAPVWRYFPAILFGYLPQREGKLLACREKS
jgi:hypothetical protein